LSSSWVCLVTDDGSQSTTQLVQTLNTQGWQVVVLRFPKSIVPERAPLEAGIASIELAEMSEAHLQEQLAAIATAYGSIGAFIHLHPRLPLNQGGDITYLERDKAIVKQVFLLAKHLKPSLNQFDGEGRSCFLTTARLDGAFGFSQQSAFSPISAGLFGLTKSLNQEWPKVFCRAIDLTPELDAEQSVQAILAEMHDPNLDILEVAYGTQGRTTLASR
jgi:NAD(P)-dependent dehydrogenase (short-subunit alcohol dehydrogenase family)